MKKVLILGSLLFVFAGANAQTSTKQSLDAVAQPKKKDNVRPSDGVRSESPSNTVAIDYDKPVTAVKRSNTGTPATKRRGSFTPKNWDAVETK